MSRETNLLRAQLLIEAADLLDENYEDLEGYEEELNEGFTTNYRKHYSDAAHRFGEALEDYDDELKRFGQTTSQTKKRRNDASRGFYRYPIMAYEVHRQYDNNSLFRPKNLKLKNRKWSSDPENAELHDRINYRTEHPKK